MLKIILIGLLSFSIAQAESGEVADASAPSAESPRTQRPRDQRPTNDIPEILQELRQTDLELQAKAGSTCPAGNFEVTGSSKITTVTIYDKKEDGYYFGNGLSIGISPSGTREYTDMVKTKEGTFVCKNVVTTETKIRSKISLINTETIEKTCNGVKTTTRRTFEVSRVRGGKLNVKYESESLSPKGSNRWIKDQTCLYKPPRKF